eukprot:SAG11_NODE_5033_length_1684_cov_20.278233_2_plen_43_part_00
MLLVDELQRLGEINLPFDLPDVLAVRRQHLLLVLDARGRHSH